MLRFPIVVVLTLGALTITNQTPGGLSSKERGAPATQQELRLVTVGQSILSTGRHGAFRAYESADGVKATVSYATFDTGSEAQVQIKQWIKSSGKVIRSENKKTPAGEVIEERRVAILGNKSTPRMFLIIKRIGLNCYIISSASLPVAEQVEDLIAD